MLDVRFRVGRIEACVSEDDAVRLVACLLDRETPAATRAAVRVMRVLQGKVAQDAV